MKSRFFAVALCCGLVHGCAVPKEADKPVSGQQTLEQLAYESFQMRDAVRADKLEKLAADIESEKIKWDGPVMEAIEKAGAEAAEETWRPTAKAAGTLLNSGKYDKTKVAAAVRDIARGARKASK
jgi:hypothetical protein